MTRDALCPRCGTFKPGNATQCANCGMPFSQLNDAGVPAAVAEQGTPAGFWVRLVALIIDSVVVSLVGTVVFLAFGGNYWEGVVVAETSDGMSEITVNAWAYVATFIYSVFFLAIWGTTPGKRILNIYVLDAQGRKRLGLIRAIARTLATFLSGIILLIGYLMVAFRRDKRALHDLIAGTYPTIKTRR
jgi:uncharacterized RDD family membrane protein YckC